MSRLCPSCDYENFHPQATHCELCGVVLDESEVGEAATREPTTGRLGGAGSLRELAAEVASGVTPESDLTAAKTSADLAVSKRKKKSASDEVDVLPPLEPADMVLSALALPVTLPAVLLSLILFTNPRRVPSALYAVCGLLVLVGGGVAGHMLALPWLGLTTIPSAIVGSLLFMRQADSLAVPSLIGTALAALVLGGMLLAGPSERVLAGHRRLVLGVAAGPQGKWITGGGDQTLLVWQADGVVIGRVNSAHEKAITGVAFLGDGSQAASVGQDGYLRAWTVGTSSKFAEFRGFRGGIGCLAASGSKVVYGASENAAVSVRDLDPSTTNDAIPLAGLASAVKAVNFDATGARVAAGDDSGRVVVWKLPKEQGEAAELVGNFAEVDERGARYVGFDGDGNVITAGRTGSVKLWKVGEEAPIRLLGSAGKPLNGAALSPDRTLLATGHSDRVIRLWDLASGKSGGSYPLGEGDHPPTTLAFSRNGKWLAVVNEERVRLLPVSALR